MSLPRAFALSISLVLLAAFAVRAEEEAETPASTLDEVVARLGVDEAREAAWGAHLAGRDGHPEAIPALLELLRHHRTPFTREWNLAHRAAFDALILLDARAPEGLLGLHEGRFAVQVLVLRAREPENHLEGLRAAFDRALGREHLHLHAIAAGNLLARAKDEGLAAKLLARIHLTLEISVFTPGPGFGGIGGSRSIRAGFGDALARVPEGFPPWAHYGLRAEGGPGREVLAAGPRTVWSHRRVVSRNGAIIGSRAHYAQPIDCALEWVGVLLGDPGDAPTVTLQPRKKISHLYETPEAYLVAATKARGDLLEAWWDLARRLRAKERLRPAELRALEPTLTLKVHDGRADRDPPLPDVPPPTRPAFAR